ncbi:glutamate-cysteine ligase family protein [Streptomyces sp. NPDC101776]
MSASSPFRHGSDTSHADRRTPMWERRPTAAPAARRTSLGVRT